LTGLEPLAATAAAFWFEQFTRKSDITAVQMAGRKRQGVINGGT
jgi:hypothetical protein